MRVLAESGILFREFPLLRKRMLRATISVWSSWPSDAVRVVALLTLHQLCRKYGKLLEGCIKVMYQQYATSCRALSMHNLGQAALLLNGLVEMFTIQPEKGVIFGTRALRQMASLIQQATKRPDKENVRKVICWQFIALIRFWCCLLAVELEKNSNSPYKTLLHPLCNMLACLLSFQTTPRYFGFHFHCIASAADLSTRAGCVIPIAASLLKIIAHISKQPLYKLETKKAAYDLVALYKVTKSETSTKGYLECVGDEALFYLLQFLARQAGSLTFPEVASPILSTLKNIINGSVNIKVDRTYKKQVEGHIIKITQQMKEIEMLRVKEAITPAVLAAGRTFEIPESHQPLLTYVTNLEKVRNVKRKLLASAAQEVDQADEIEPSKKKRSASDKVQKTKSKEAIVPKKRKIAQNPPTSTKIKGEKTRKKRATQRGDEDIVEDFVLDD
jgi:nucleolar complex protein 2